MNVTEEATLIAAAGSGDVASFEALYRIHAGRVYGLCLRLSDTQADAQDAAQETFIKAWRGLRTFRGDCALSTWLHRIAFNEAMALKRRHATEHRHLQVVAVPASSEGERSETERLEQAIATLPDRAREALVLHKIYGYTHEETAEFMRIAVGTCKAQVHRALQLLRQRLAPADTAPESADAIDGVRGRNDQEG